jgi:archaeal type IV pilus assembly protein PilA
MNLCNTELGVSEIIGTILAVALTVILAAIVAAYMFGMLNGIGFMPMLAITADQTDPNHIQVTYRGGADQSTLANLTIMWPSGKSQRIDFPRIGDVYTATNFAAPLNVTTGKDHVVVSARFANNNSQVVLDTFV